MSATFFAEGPFLVGVQTALGEDDTHHLRVARIGLGECVGLRDGAGEVATGRLVRVGKKQAFVEVDERFSVLPPPAVHVLVPVADRDRTLWLAEKLAELNVATWRPVLWQRSKSVSPRGEGSTFRARIRARMVSAMLQSQSAWIPEIFPESPLARAIAAAPVGTRVAFDSSGTAARDAMTSLPITLAIGPEGGFEPSELEQLQAGGFVLASLGPSILRFETAAVAAVAVARAMLLTSAHV